MPAPSTEPISSTTLPASPAPRPHFVDGLRGLAMLSVLLYHCWQNGGEWGWTPFGPHSVNLAAPLGFGYVGVNLFLVLSGFCLYWPLTRPDRPEPTLWAFAQKRCRRILPPYYAALLFFWALLLLDVLTHHHFHEDATSVRHVILSLGWHLLMLHNLSPDYILSINGVFWSLGLEFSLYILFPVLVEAFKRFGPWLPTFAVLAIDLGWRHAVAKIVGPETPIADSFVLCSSLPGRCFEFAAGMTAAWLVANRKRPATGQGCTAVSFCAGVGAVWVSAHYGFGSIFPDVLWGGSFAALLVAAAWPAGILNRALSAPWLVKLGVFSYSVYLIHLPLTKALDALAVSHHWPVAVFGVFVIAPLILLLGYLFHLRFEKPFMNAPKSRAPSSGTPPRWV